MKLARSLFLLLIMISCVQTTTVFALTLYYKTSCNDGFVRAMAKSHTITFQATNTIAEIKAMISRQIQIPATAFMLSRNGWTELQTNDIKNGETLVVIFHKNGETRIESLKAYFKRHCG